MIYLTVSITSDPTASATATTMTTIHNLTTLPTEVQTNVTAEGNYPAAAAEICFFITQKSMGELMTVLADQL